MRYKVPCDPSTSGNKLSLRTEAFYVCLLHENKIKTKTKKPPLLSQIIVKKIYAFYFILSEVQAI